MRSCARSNEPVFALDPRRRATRRDGLLENAAPRVFRRFLSAVKTLSSQLRIPARFVLGLIWGTMPCAPVYGVLPLALISGSAQDGALIMLAFGIGTLPNLRAWFGSPTGRIVAGAVVADLRSTESTARCS